jgi:hypothetical protein
MSKKKSMALPQEAKIVPKEVMYFATKNLSQQSAKARKLFIPKRA